VAGNGRRIRDRAPAAGSSWEHVADWYDGWVGERGSAYHRGLAIPAVMTLLDPKPGEDILDVGAGQGVLAPYITANGARYVGVDASPRLVAVARRRHGRLGRFHVADARALPADLVVRHGRFDAAVFLLSIQDMDPLDAIFASLDRVLDPSSRVVLFMTHPAFRQPRHAGWGWDQGRGLVFRRIDSYLTPLAVPMKQVGAGPPTRSYHRPISAYVNGLAEVGFAIDAMHELSDLPEDRRPRSRRPGARDPGSTGSGPRRPADRAEAEIPLFLGLRARRG
jgi:SAM-dependent methyltransferase